MNDSTVSRKTCPPIRIETDPINRISLPANQNSAQNFLEFSSTFLLLSLAPHQCPSLANLGPLPRALSTAERVSLLLVSGCRRDKLLPTPPPLFIIPKGTHKEPWKSAPYLLTQPDSDAAPLLSLSTPGNCSSAA